MLTRYDTTYALDGHTNHTSCMLHAQMLKKWGFSTAAAFYCPCSALPQAKRVVTDLPFIEGCVHCESFILQKRCCIHKQHTR
jgi:hypothetical protein